MTKKTKTVEGITFAEGVNTDEVFSGDDTAEDAALAKDLSGAIKRRITTLLDEDVYAALKARAKTEGDGKYQTYLNAVLRRILFGTDGSKTDEALLKKFNKILADLKNQHARMEAIERRIATMAPKKSKAARKRA